MATKTFDRIIVFTDGSCTGNGKKTAHAGIGIYFPSKEFKDISEAFTLTPITNQRAELYAIHKALMIIDEASVEFENIDIYTDSLYSIKCVTEWIKKWEINKWKGATGKVVLNQDIIRPINDLLKKHDGKISFKHVRSHTGETNLESVYNDRADKLACAGTLKSTAAKPILKVKTSSPIKIEI